MPCGPAWAPTAGLLLSTALTLFAVVVGYQLILRFNRVMVWLSGLALVTTLVYTGIHAADGGAAHVAGAGGSFNWAGFLGMASVVGVWQLSYAPYVSDYSRYLPSSTSTRAAFWYTYAGTVLGVIGAMSVGAFLVAGLGQNGGLADLDGIMPHPVFVFVMLMFFLGAIDAGVINMYGSSLCVLTCIQTFKLSWAPRASARHLTAVLLAIAVFIVSTTVSDNFVTDYTNFILVLAYLLVPWSIINLIDYYLVHKGNYDPSRSATRRAATAPSTSPPSSATSWRASCRSRSCRPRSTSGRSRSRPDAVDTSWVVGSIATAFIYLGLLRLWRRQPAPVLAPEAEVSA